MRLRWCLRAVPRVSRGGEPPRFYGPHARESGQRGPALARADVALWQRAHGLGDDAGSITMHVSDVEREVRGTRSSTAPHRAALPGAQANVPGDRGARLGFLRCRMTSELHGSPRLGTAPAWGSTLRGSLPTQPRSCNRTTRSRQPIPSLGPESGTVVHPESTTIDGTIYIVDDEEDSRLLLALLLRPTGLRVETFGSAEEFLGLAAFARHGCIVLDLLLPGVNGLEAQRRLLARGCNLPLVFVSGFGDVSSASQALKAGAFDFLEKPVHGQQLVETLQAALSYHLVLLRREHRREAAMMRLGLLTPREREILRYLVDGWASKTIAAKLGRSKKTIDLHRANILRKVAVSSSAALVRLVLDSEDESLLHVRDLAD